MTIGYLRPVRHGLLVGANTVSGDFSTAQAQALQTRLGVNLDLVMFYQSFGGEPALYASQFATARALNAIPQGAWQPSGVGIVDQILSGVYDPVIDDSASRCKAFGLPVHIRFAYEMNGNWTAYGPSSTTDANYILMWRRVVDRFRAAGATNVQWVWSPNIWSASKGAVASPLGRYPGDAYVDIIGLDGYQNLTSSSWLTFAELFAADHKQLVGLAPGKPFAVSEFGQGEPDARGSRHQWMQDALAAIPRMNNVRFVTFFDRNKLDGEGDYTLDVTGSDQAGATIIGNILSLAPYA